MKVIFLDIDGVMNHETWLCSEECRTISPVIDGERNNFRWFNPRCVELLNDLTDATEAKIIISSTWRLGKSLESLKELFNEVGITGLLIAKTPNLKYYDSTSSVPRGCEIHEWIEKSKAAIDRYVILDDDSDILYWQRENFIWVDPYSGLTPSIIYQAKNKLLTKENS